MKLSRDGDRPYVVGISGGSAAGKTMVAGFLAEMMDDIDPLVVGVDRYFRDKSHLTSEERAKLNYDIPDALDFERLGKDLKGLREMREVYLPVYDYATHSARQAAELAAPSRLVIVEGILLFHPDDIKPLIDFRIFVEAEQEERLRRRIARDKIERGRTEKSVIAQFYGTVEPAFSRYTEPTRVLADEVLDWNTINTEGLEKIADRIRERMPQVL